VTDRCNFRCPYCMPAELYGEGYRFLPRTEVLTFEEIERLTRRFVDLGVTKIRLTGGEPLVRADLPSLVARLAAIRPDLDLTLTTNGSLLAPAAAELAAAGLRRVTVSLDSLDPAVFRRMSGRDSAHPDTVLAGIAAAEWRRRRVRRTGTETRHGKVEPRHGSRRVDRGRTRHSRGDASQSITKARVSHPRPRARPARTQDPRCRSTSPARLRRVEARRGRRRAGANDGACLRSSPCS